MIVLPAIDIYEGNVVRLFQGDYQKMTVYSSDACQQAKQFEEQGASWLHVVDLQGAKSGKCENASVIEKIVRQTHLNVEVGGGIRNRKTVEQYLSMGVQRVILGSKALDASFLKECIQSYGEKIAVGVDSRDGKVAIHGWTEKTSTDSVSFVESLAEKQVKTVIVTDISKDGAMKGCNRQLYQQLAQLPIQVIASGGVSSLPDIQALAELPVYGAILGKALYEQAVSLKQALMTAGGVL